MNWPNNEDGQVFRNLQQENFDFSKVHDIDFNIDFDHWPLSSSEIETIKSLYPDCKFIYPDKEDIENGIVNGYVLFPIKTILTYDFVIKTQQQITKQMQQFGGWCESWGLFSN